MNSSVVFFNNSASVQQFIPVKQWVETEIYSIFRGSMNLSSVFLHISTNAYSSLQICGFIQKPSEGN